MKMYATNCLVRWIRGRKIQLIASFTASLGIFAFGLCHVWPAPVLPKLMADDSPMVITHAEGSWIASIGLISIPICAFGSIFLMKSIGGKYILLLSSLPVLISWLLIILATNVYYFYAARLVLGFADVLCFVSASVYIGEISEPTIRGRLLSLVAMCFYAGAIVTYYFGYVMSIKSFAYLGIVFPVITFVSFIWMPQSPYYMLMQKKIDTAKRNLYVLRNYPDAVIDAEFETIKKNVEEEMLNEGNFMDLFRDAVNRKALFLVVMATVIQQFSGLTSMEIYVHYVLLESDLKMDAAIAATIFGLIQFFTCFISVGLVDWLGRRPLLLISCGGAAVSLIFEGVYFYMKINHYDIESFTWVPVVALLVYIFFESIGLATIPYMLQGEMFATNIKSYAIGVTCSAFGLFGFVSNKMFQIMTDSFGMHAIFFTFAGCSICGAIFIYFYLPETKNKSLQQIQSDLRDSIVAKKITV